MSSAPKPPGPRIVSDEDRAFPHNHEAERNLLGCIHIDNALLKKAAAAIEPGDFFTEAHRYLFSAMLKMHEAGLAINSVSLLEHLQAAGNLEAAGGVYFSQISDGVLADEFPTYLRIVRDFSKLRLAAHIGELLKVSALEPGANFETISASTILSLENLRAPNGKPDDVVVFPDMPDAVLDGRLGEICRERLEGFPVAYSWISILTAAGTLVPKNLTYPNVRTNLYACPIGPIDSGKSQVIERAIAITGVKEPQLEKTLAGSAEGLLAKLSEADRDSRLLSPDELGHLLTKARIDNATFPYTLNTLFYKDECAALVARGKQIFVDCSLSIIGGIVEDAFEQCFGTATTGGLYDRFVFGVCPQPFTYSYRPFEGDEEENFMACPMRIAPDVWEARDEWVRTIPGLSPRCAELAIRAATIAAAFDRRPILTAKNLGPAKAFAESQSRIRAKLKPNPGENTDAKCAFAILAALGGSGDWFSKREIHRKTHSEKFGPSAFEKAIRSLESTGDILVNPARPVKVRRV